MDMFGLPPTDQARIDYAGERVHAIFRAGNHEVRPYPSRWYVWTHEGV